MSQDQTIVTTAVPIITNEFKAIEDVGWYTSAYLLTTSSVQIAYGKLYTILSVKLVLLMAIAIFELGSIICAAVSNSTFLIMGRASAGSRCGRHFPRKHTCSRALCAHGPASGAARHHERHV